MRGNDKLFIIKRMKNIIKNTYEKVKKEVNDKMLKNNILGKYQSFSPKTNIKSNNKNIKMLKEALKNKKNKNIAISGKYGSGKSSIIKSFFNKPLNKLLYNPIFVSLGMFENSLEVNDLDKFSQQVEKSIIQQILYTERADNLPDSNISRIGKVRIKHYKSLIFLITTITCIFLIKDGIITWEYFINIFRNLKEYILLLIENNKLILLGLTALLIACVIFMLTCFIKWIFKSLARIIKNLKIKNIIINLKSTQIEISSKKEESLINKYLDELVYFFSITNYKTIIIEDLDRFINKNNNEEINQKINKKILIIFQKLKELNEILNNSKEIKRRICFIYAVKDDLFENQHERTKFFDFIVPVIPILSTYNSYAELERQITERNININKSVLLELADYIDDYRLMSSIVNEYILYNEVLEKEQLDTNKLFALIVLKNIKPVEFDALMEDRGNIYEILKKQSEIVSNIQKKYLIQINLNKEHIQKLKEENLKSFKELKLILLGMLCNKSASGYRNGSMTVEEFLKDSTTKEFIESQKIDIYISGRGTYYENVIFREMEKEEFIERANTIEEKYNRKKEILERENSRLLTEINSIKRRSLKELLSNSEIDLSEIKGECGELEFNLILNGYIDENYKEYMFKFKESELIKKQDNLFIYNNKGNKPTEFDYTLNNVELIIDMLEEKFFGSTNILNFNIAEYLLNSKEEKHKTKKMELLKLLIGETDENKEDLINSFIYSFISRGSKYYKLLNGLYELDDQIILKLLDYYKENSIDKFEEMIKILLRLPKLLNQENVNKIIEKYIMEITNFEDWIEFSEDVKKSLLILKIKFKCIEKPKNEEILDYIYENNLYLLNVDMIKLMFEYKGYSDFTFNIKNLTIILKEEKMLKMKEYILQKPKEYIENCYLKTNNAYNETECITEVINNWKIDDEIKENIIKNFNNKVDNIENIVLAKYKELYMKYDKIKISWENIYNYYKATDSEITQVLIDFIERNIDDIIKNNISQVVRTQDFFYMCEKIAKNNIIKIEIYKKLIPNLKMKITTINKEEIAKERMQILVQNKMIGFNTNNFDVIAIESTEVVDEYIVPYIKGFIEDINDFEIDAEIINVILKSLKIKFSDKTKIIQKVSIELLNEDTLEYIIDNYRKNKIAKIKTDVKEKIFSSEVEIANKIKFFDMELNIEISNEKIKGYMEIIGEPFSFIGNLELKSTVFSIPKYTNSMSVLKKLQQRGFLFSYKEHSETITIYNKKQII